MKHWRWILTLLFGVLVALASAQTFQRSLPFLAKPASAVTDLCTLSIGNGYPTNIDGYTAYSWWVVQCNYTTNASGAVLKDLGPNGLDLTNKAAASGYPILVTNSLNGFSIISFDGVAAYHLKSIGWTNLLTQEEIVMVVAITNKASQCNYYDSTTSGQERILFSSSSSSLVKAYAGSTVTLCDLGGISNRWAVVNSVWNGASSTIYTNLVQGGTANPGAQTHRGFMLGMNYDGITLPAAMKVAEVITYRTNLTATIRSNVFNYLTNKYAISP